MWNTHAIAPHSPAEVRGDAPLRLPVFEVAVDAQEFFVLFVFPLCKCLD